MLKEDHTLYFTIDSANNLITALVKAYDSVQHDVIQKSLEMLGALIEIITWPMKLCSKFQVVIKVGDEESHVDAVLNKDAAKRRHSSLAQHNYQRLKSRKSLKSTELKCQSISAPHLKTTVLNHSLLNCLTSLSQ